MKEKFKSHEISEIDLKEIFHTLKVRKWFILIVMIIVLVITWIGILNIAPKYQSSALIQVENKEQGLSGIFQNMPKMDGMFSSNSSALPSQIETALMRSRFILGPTIERLRLNIKIKPFYFPIFGMSVANRYKGKSVAKPFLGISKYAWGGEIVKVERFNVPRSLLNQKFILVAKAHRHYLLYAPDGQLVVRGRVGRLERTRYSHESLPYVHIVVSQLKANAGAKFVLIKKPLYQGINQLLKTLTVSDLGDQSKDRTKTGILSLSLKGTQPKVLRNILNTIINLEVQKNFEKKSIEAQKTLNFLNRQLPVLKKKLDQAETALSSYQAERGSLGISIEGKALLDQTIKVETSIETLKLKRIELLERFTRHHPFIIALSHEQKKSNDELNLLEAKIRKLPKTEQKSLSLKRNVEVQGKLYLLLLSKRQQLNMIKAGTVSDVRVLDYASYSLQLPRKRILITILSLIFGFMLAVVIIFLRLLFSHSVDDPDYIEERLKVPAFAVIPYSKKQAMLFRNMERKIPGTGPFVLAQVHPKDMAIEGVRSLRTILQFALHESKNNIISILGANPNVGKSFVALNLSYVLSDSGKNVLLVDADLRKGKLKNYVSKKALFGLSDILMNKCSLDDAIVELQPQKLSFISSGKYPRNPSELLLSQDFETFMKEASSRYDVVIIDTSPILAVTDGILVARHAGINLLVCTSKDHLKELEHTVQRVRKNRLELNGLIINNKVQTQSRYGHYNYYYDYSSPE